MPIFYGQGKTKRSAMLLLVALKGRDQGDMGILSGDRQCQDSKDDDMEVTPC